MLGKSVPYKRNDKGRSGDPCRAPYKTAFWPRESLYTGEYLYTYLVSNL